MAIVYSLQNVIIFNLLVVIYLYSKLTKTMGMYLEVYLFWTFSVLCYYRIKFL